MFAGWLISGGDLYMSIKKIIVFSILGLLVITVSVIQYSTYVSTEKVLLKHAHEMMSSAAKDTIERSINFLVPAQAAAKLSQRLANHNVVSNENPEILERYFYEQLKQNESFAGIYYGTTDGGFVYIKHDESLQSNGYVTKIIEIVGEDRLVAYTWRDRFFNVLKNKEAREDDYDPRTRPWYKSAIDKHELIWTDPYIFYSSQQPGITTANAVYKNRDASEATGVIGVDIEITALSDFLQKLKIGNSGSAFILNQYAEVVAYPELEKIKQESKDKAAGLQFRHINELDNRVAKGAYSELINRGYSLDLKQQIITRFAVDGIEYQGVFTPFNHSQWPWVIALYVPTDDYIGTFRNNLWNNIYLSMVIALFASFIGYMIAQRIIEPIKALGDNARRVMLGKHADVTEISSRFRDIKTTAIAFSKMAFSLKEKEERNQELTFNLKQANLSAIVRLSDAAEFKDKNTAEHIIRMSGIAEAIARELNLDDEFCENIRYAAPMHDIGKIGIPDAVLMKPAKLTAEEWVMIKTHPQIGADILKNPETEMLKMAHAIAITHHEKWNGKGYPMGIKGTEIPIEGRICAVADVVDALLSRRCYKEPMEIEMVFNIIREESGQHFDPACVDAFFRAETAVKKIYSNLIYEDNQ